MWLRGRWGRWYRVVRTQARRSGAKPGTAELVISTHLSLFLGTARHHSRANRTRKPPPFHSGPHLPNNTRLRHSKWAFPELADRRRKRETRDRGDRRASPFAAQPARETGAVSGFSASFPPGLKLVKPQSEFSYVCRELCQMPIDQRSKIVLPLSIGSGPPCV